MLHYGLYLSVCQKLGVLSKWLNGSGGFWHRERKCAENYNKHNKFIFFKPISILLISNQNSFRVLFDKTASVYLIWKIYILPLEMASSGNQHCANYIGNFVPYGGFLPPILHCVIRKYRLLVHGPGRHLGQTSVTSGICRRDAVVITVGRTHRRLDTVTRTSRLIYSHESRYNYLYTRLIRWKKISTWRIISETL